MSYSISTLLTRTVHDAFGENDPARRRAGIDEIFTEDCVLYEPGAPTMAATRSIAWRVRSRLLTLTFDISQLPSLKNWAKGRVHWVSARPGEAPDSAGTDFIITRDGRIAAIYLVFDKRPEMDSAVPRSGKGVKRSLRTVFVGEWRR